MTQPGHQQPPDEKATHNGSTLLGSDTEPEVTYGSPTAVESSPLEAHEVVPIAPPTAPPNGGLVAWLQVAGCFALYLNTL